MYEFRLVPHHPNLTVVYVQFKEMVTHDDAFEVEDGLILVAKWANPRL
jgi:hypothetical protein